MKLTSPNSILSYAVALLLMAVGSANAITLLSTGFDSTSNDGSTLSGITYSDEVGLSGPGSLNGNALHTSTDATGHYAPNVQVNNSQWEVDIPFTVTGANVQVDNVLLDRQHFNVSGNFNTSGGKTYPIIATLIGSSSGQVGQVTVDPNPWPNSAATETFAFGGVTLTNSEAWILNVQVNDGTATNAGIFVGFDGFAIEGSVGSGGGGGGPVAAKFANFEFNTGNSFGSTDLGTSWTTSDLTNGPSVPLGTNAGSGVPEPSLQLSFDDVGANLTESLGDGDFYSFTVTPDAGSPATFTDLMFDFFKTNAAGANVTASLFSDVDGFSAGDLIDEVMLLGGGESGAFFSKSFDLTSMVGDITGPVTFRIYIDDANAANQTNQFRLDNIMLLGTVQGSTVVPEPATATLAMLGLGGLVMRRRRNATVAA